MVDQAINCQPHRTMSPSPIPGPTPTCPHCGAALLADAPAGLCPACLMSAGLPTLDEAGATQLVERPTARDLPNVGETFGGYRIERELGHGGMGAVYAAEQIESGRRVALKVLSRKLDSPDARARFLREGRLAASINHPNSVYVFGTEEVEGTPVISMELIAGGTLQERVQRQGPLPVGEAVDAVLQIIAGLEAAQAIGILHRDIKPANCFQDIDGTVKVGDFGLSISTAARGESQLTLPGDFLGTPAFCPPEQLRGDELNVRSDMYAVGVTLYYLLTGRTPFEGKNMVQLLANSLEKPAPPPSLFRPEIPKSLSQVVLRCLEKIPASRHASYAELRRALQPFTSTSPTPATLGLRFVAQVVDHLLFMGINLIIPFLVLDDVMFFADPENVRSTAWYWLSGAMFILRALYSGILEGIWGATLGEAAVGLRVARLNRSAPGIPRALGRYMLLAWPSLLSYLFFQYDPHEKESLWLAFAMLGVWCLFMLAMFSTVRRRNGFAAVHDLLTGTRVIQKAEYEPRPAVTAGLGTVTTTESMAKIGPCQILATLSEGVSQTIMLGYDTRLLRKVWIRTTPPGGPPVPAPLRNAARATRLRWLQGLRGAAESWDAYEAVEGAPLTSLLREPQPWRSVRHWLLDLARELDAASKDGSLPEVLALDRVWITPAGRAKLLDFPFPAAHHTDEIAPPGGSGVTSSVFLNQVALSALEGRPATVEEAATRTVEAPLPLEAARALRELSATTDLSETVATLTPLLQRPPEIPRWKRMALVLACATPALVCGLFLGLGFAVSRAIFVKNPGLMDLHTCVLVHEDMADALKAKGMENVPLAKAREAMEIHISSAFGHLIRDDKVWSAPMVKGMLRPHRRAIAEGAVAHHPSPTEQEVQEARAMLRPILEQPIHSHPTDGVVDNQTSQAPGRKAGGGMLMPEQDPGLMSFIMSGAMLFCLMVAAALSLLCAVAFRGGMLMHMLGIAVVTARGRQATRLRMLWRALIAWSPVICTALVLKFSDGRSPAAITAPIITLLSLTAALAIVSLIPRRRSPQDHLAGTWLVPR